MKPKLRAFWEHRDWGEGDPGMTGFGRMHGNVIAGERKHTSDRRNGKCRSTEQPVLCGWSVEGWDWGVCGGRAEEMGPHRDRNGSCGTVYVSLCKERGPREMVTGGFAHS